MTTGLLLAALLGCSPNAQGLGSAGAGSTGDDRLPTSTGVATSTGAATSSVDAEGSSATTGGPGDTTSPSGDTKASDTGDETGPPPSCAGRLWWELDFTADPTTLDVNTDGTPDWALRNGDPFPVEQLGGGVWTSTPWVTLDTRPLDDFQGRTIAWVRMRNTEVGSGRGAVLWLNVGYDRDRFAPIFASLMRQRDGTQRLEIVNAPGGPGPLVGLSGLGAGMVEVTLELDTDAETVGVRVDGVDQGSFPLAFRSREGNDDRWATLVAWDTEAEFDAVRVEQCD